MKKIIVTGGSGFIGTNLVNFLIKKKYFVINIDKLTYSSNKLDISYRNRKNYKFIKVDINNKKLAKIIHQMGGMFEKGPKKYRQCRAYMLIIYF